MIKKLSHSHLLKKIIFLLMFFCAAEFATAQITTAADDTSVETYSAPSSDPRALAWAKNSTRLYIAGNSSIYEYTVGSTISASESFASGDANNVINVKTLGDGSATQAYDVDDITGLAFSDDGQYLYFVGVGGVDDDYINQLYLSTAWDLSTAGRLSTSRRLISGFSIPQDIQFNGDGTKAYVLAADDLKIYEFELDAPYSINSSTPSPGGSANELFITGEANPSGFSFNANGSRLFVAGNGADRITEYYLPDLYEISTAVIGASFFLSGTQIEAIAVNRYDHKILVLDNTSNSLFQYSFNGYPTTSSVSPDNTNNPDKSDVRFRVTFSENVTGFGTRNMTVVKTGTVTYGNISVSKTNTTGSGANSYYVDLADVTGNGSLKIDIKEANTGGVKDYDGEPLSGAYTTGKVQAIGSAFSVLSASYRVSDYFDVNEVVSGATITWDVKVSDDGSKLFVLDRTLDRVLEFTLSTPNDITTATYNGDSEALSLTGIETSPSGMSFQSDGSTLFILGETVDGITEFSLSTPYDVSTASFVRSTAVSPSNNANDGFDFSSDGMKVFIAREGSTDVIAEYNLSAPYDITTITATGVEFDINPYETGVRDLEIVNDGRFMIVVGENSEIIHTIELTTPNDLSTATYREDYALSTTDREDQMLGIGFSMLGDWMYVIGSDEIVYSYSLNKAPFIRNFAISEDHNPSSSQGVIEIEFSESVSGFTADDLEIEHFGSATGELGTLTGSEELYELTISGIDGDGAIVVSIKEDSGISDLLGTSYTGGSTGFMVGSAYNFEQAVESGDFDLDDEDTTPNGITFNATGDKMYILGGTGDDVNVYDLSTYFDVTTAVYKPSETLVLSDISNPDKILFNRYGTKLFVRNNSNSSLHEYSLSTPFDVSTAQYAGLSESLDNVGGDSFAFNNDGTVLFGGSSNGRIFSFPLDLAYDISSNTAGQTEEIELPIAISDFRFDHTGMRLIVATTSNPDRIVTYYLDAPYNVSSAVEAHEDLSLPFSNPIAFSFDNYGNRVFIIDSNDFVKQYDFNQKPEVRSFEEFEDEQHGYAMKLQFSEPISGVDQGDFDLVASSGVSAYSWSVANVQTENTLVRIYALGDGTIEVSLKESGTDIVDLKGADLIPKPAKLTAVLGSAFDVAQASYLGTENSYTITEETSPTSFTFNNEGSKMYVTGTSSDDLHEYNLSTPYDLTTVAFGQTFDLAISNPSEITFNSDGSKLFVLDVGVIHEFSLSTNFDISTSSYQGIDDTYVVYSEDSRPKGITFNADGTIMYMLGDFRNYINTYSLSTPYDISRATSLGSDFGFSISAEVETSPQDLQFSADGKRLLVVGNSGLDINQYSVATPWDITTATYLGDEYRLDLSTDLTSPGSMAFSADGTKLFVLSTDTGVIHSYDLNAAPVVTSFALLTEYPKNFPEAHYILTFDEPVTGVTIDDLEIITTGTASAQINELTSAGVPYIHYYISLTSLSGEGTVAINLKETGTGIIDLVGKGIETSYMSQVHEVDRVAPTATISIDDAALKVGDQPTLTIVFSEEVENFEVADIVLPNGTLSELSSSDNITFTATFTPGTDIEEATNIITLDMSEVSDLAGNVGAVDVDTENFEIDTRRPNFIDFQVFDISGGVESGGTLSSLFSFSEVVTGFDPANFTVPHGSFSDVALYQSFENTYTYTYTIPGGVESDLNVIQFDLSTITDLAGNPGVGIFSTENFIIDTNPPIFTIALDDETLTIGETTTVTYTFSEPMFLSPINTGLEFEIGFTTPNGSVSDLVFTEGTNILTFTFTPYVDIQDYTNEIFSNNIALVDGIKSDGLEGFNVPVLPSQTKSPNYIVDNIRPDINITLESSSFFSGETTTVTIVATEELIDFDLDDLNAEHATLTDLATIDNITFTATLTPDTEVDSENNLITTMMDGFSDRAGNTLESNVSSGNYEINTVIPVITFDEIEEQSIFDATIELTAVSSSGLAVSYTSSDPAVASVSGNMVTFVALGTTTITASQDATASVNAALDVDQDLIVSEIYKWNGTTWNSGSAPTTPVDVVLEGDLVVSGFIETASLYVAPGVTLTIQEDGVLKDNGTINNEGQVVVASGGSLVIMGDASGTSYEIQRNTTGNAGYSIIGAMVSGKTVADFQFDYAYSFDGTDFVLPSPSDPMLPGKGFFAGYNAASPSLIFDGTPNSGNQSYQLASADVYQLVANPYAAPIVHQQLVVGNNSFDGTIYLWDDGGENMSDIRGGGYVTVNADGMAVGSAGLQGSDAFQGNIGSGQGFFIFADVATSIDFTPAMQSIEAGKNRDENFYRKVSDSQFLRLKLTQNDLSDELLVVFKEGATYELDKGLDAKKLMNNGLSFYSQFNKERLAIQTLPKESEEMVIPLGFRLLEEGKITIALSEAVNLETHTELYLIDKVTDKVHNLNQEQSLSMSTTQTINENRFELMIVRNVLITDHFPSELQVFGKPGELVLYYPKTDGEEAITIYTIDGRIVHQSEVKFENATKKAIVKGTFSKETIYILSVDGHNLKFLLK